MSIDAIDRSIARLMRGFYPTAIRLSFAIIFIWFGILKPLGLSAAEPLVLSTVAWMPFLSPQHWLAVIGWWEVAIGLLFISRQTTRLAIFLLFLQMGGTFLPLFILHELTFQAGGIPLLPTMEGQYIIKNLMILSAALVMGSLVRKNDLLDSRSQITILSKNQNQDGRSETEGLDRPNCGLRNSPEAD